MISVFHLHHSACYYLNINLNKNSESNISTGYDIEYNLKTGIRLYRLP